LDFFIELEIKEVERIIKKLKGFHINERILSKNILNKYKDRLGLKNEESRDRKNGIDILKNIKGRSGKLEAGDFVSYFRSRFESLRDILIKNGELDNLSSIRRIGRENGVFCIIGMVYSKRITKNKNLFIEVEDLTGKSIVLINKENKELFIRAQNLLLDDIVAFRVSGSNKMLFANDFIYPDAKLKKENIGDRDEFIAFVSDFHIGSKMFLEGNLMRFVDWLNGKIGDSRQKNLAQKVRYLILSGDNIEGVGVYPNQEKFLKIKGCRKQYEKLADILGMIRKDIEIVMCPGQYDAVWVGEPQSAINEKWSGDLNNMENLKLVSNPSIVKIRGLNILVYYGGSVNQFRNLISGGRDLNINDFTNEILKRRHLAPVYGEMDIIPNKNIDDLIINELPDVFVVSGQHRAMIGNYNNILTISTSCWQSRTDFETKVGSEPDPCKVPILNLKSKEIKILDFSGKDIVWESGDDLVCELEDYKK